jgi:hypothetical protein
MMFSEMKSKIKDYISWFGNTDYYIRFQNPDLIIIAGRPSMGKNGILFWERDIVEEDTIFLLLFSL